MADNTKSGADIFAISSSVANSCGTAGGAESLLNGHYALLMEGFAGSGAGTPLLVGASFVANGSGGVTGGEEDVNDTIAPQHLSVCLWSIERQSLYCGLRSSWLFATHELGGHNHGLPFRPERNQLGRGFSGKPNRVRR